VQTLDNMIRERVDVKDFKKIAKEHKHFLWHFLQKNQESSTLTFFSYFLDKNEIELPNLLKQIVDLFDIPYFESYTEDSMDFLYDVGIKTSLLYKPQFVPTFYIPREQFFHSSILGFNHYSMVSSTMKYCYCPEGLTNVVMDLDPQYVLNLNID